VTKSVGGGVLVRVQGNEIGPTKWLFLQCQAVDMMVMISLKFAFIVVAINDIFFHSFILHSFV
jgi:hypothetical protein